MNKEALHRLDAALATIGAFADNLAESGDVSGSAGFMGKLARLGEAIFSSRRTGAGDPVARLAAGFDPSDTVLAWLVPDNYSRNIISAIRRMVTAGEVTPKQARDFTRAIAQIWDDAAQDMGKPTNQ